ncbi:MAG: hypothetical protein RQ867_05915 [Mariprofundaceae bacterium]|nr:hypothetical protein [Mariprofundaceae bacterium]
MSSHRVQVTLDNESFAAVHRVSLLTGCSMSSVIAGLLQPNVSALTELADVLEKAKTLREGLSDGADYVFRIACEHASTKCAPDLEQCIDNSSENDLEPVFNPFANLHKPEPAKTPSAGIEQWEFDLFNKGPSDGGGLYDHN